MKKYPEGGIKYVIKKDVCGRAENAILDKIPCFDSDCCWYQSYRGNPVFRVKAAPVFGYDRHNCDCSVLCGLVTGYMVKAGLFKKIWGVILTWLVCTLVNVISASCITIFVFGGATGVTGTSVLTATLLAATKNIITSVLSSSMIENLLDKAIAFGIAYILVKKIPRRFMSQYASSVTDDDVEKE